MFFFYNIKCIKIYYSSNFQLHPYIFTSVTVEPIGDPKLSISINLVYQSFTTSLRNVKRSFPEAGWIPGNE